MADLSVSRSFRCATGRLSVTAVGHLCHPLATSKQPPPPAGDSPAAFSHCTLAAACLSSEQLHTTLTRPITICFLLDVDRQTSSPTCRRPRCPLPAHTPIHITHTPLRSARPPRASTPLLLPPTAAGRRRLLASRASSTHRSLPAAPPAPTAPGKYAMRSLATFAYTSLPALSPSSSFGRSPYGLYITSSSPSPHSPGSQSPRRRNTFYQPLFHSRHKG